MSPHTPPWPSSSPLRLHLCCFLPPRSPTSRFHCLPSSSSGPSPSPPPPLPAAPGDPLPVPPRRRRPTVDLRAFLLRTALLTSLTAGPSTTLPPSGLSNPLAPSAPSAAAADPADSLEPAAADPAEPPAADHALATVSVQLEAGCGG